jgi:UDP-N-acetylglucosamine 2-epimerase (non-hydrolysing)
MKLIHVVGARPNFMKVAPVHRAIWHYSEIQQIIVHTGQHYDLNMSDIFFQQLGLPMPDINLEVGSGSHAVQTAQIMMRFEEAVLKVKPDIVMVYGDVNSTVAATLVCAKLAICVGHVEAGLRSFDRTMPEEINRLLTDQITDLLFTPSMDGNENLIREGINPTKIHFVGNVMIDTLKRLLPEAEKLGSKLFQELNIVERQYGLVTLHRPSNVDDSILFSYIIRTLEKISKNLPIIFPIHPRTRTQIRETGLKIKADSSLKLVDPIGYLDFLCLQQRAKLVITDSGGIQEETTFLGVPCLTVRKNTERPVTVSIGTNILVGQDMERLRVEVGSILDGATKKGTIPVFWDGKAGERIVDILANLFKW